MLAKGLREPHSVGPVAHRVPGEGMVGALFSEQVEAIRLVQAQPGSPFEAYESAQRALPPQPERARAVRAIVPFGSNHAYAE
jgi:hypothetical protein